MSKRLDHRKSDLRRATRALELRHRLRRDTVVVTQTEDPAAPSGHVSFWTSYKHYFYGIAGALVGGASVLLMTVLLDGSQSANSKESSKTTGPMNIAVEQAIGQTEQLIKMLEGIVLERGSKPNLGATENPSEYQKCLDDCASGFRVKDESAKALLVNCRNECISRYSKRVKDIRKHYYDDQYSD